MESIARSVKAWLVLLVSYDASTKPAEASSRVWIPPEDPGSRRGTELRPYEK